MRYRVEVVPEAEAAIAASVRYIAVDCRSPINAERWLQKLLHAIETLENSPRRCPLAPEDSLVSYEVRMRVIGGYLLLFTIDDSAGKVHVMHFRHGSMLPRAEHLPANPPGG
ncbi:MAG TPA: type II toxin-antitoxin system RelE/ParE family toxin [Lacipirellulaceae bacterium]|nr:type II toxin-antitoxin system RelE/ParE family toxin [Lacipirellulaceae bacterium]